MIRAVKICVKLLYTTNLIVRSKSHAVVTVSTSQKEPRKKIISD